MKIGLICRLCSQIVEHMLILTLCFTLWDIQIFHIIIILWGKKRQCTAADWQRSSCTAIISKGLRVIWRLMLKIVSVPPQSLKRRKWAKWQNWLRATTVQATSAFSITPKNLEYTNYDWQLGSCLDIKWRASPDIQLKEAVVQTRPMPIWSLKEFMYKP